LNGNFHIHARKRIAVLVNDQPVKLDGDIFPSTNFAVTSAIPMLFAAEGFGVAGVVMAEAFRECFDCSTCSGCRSRRNIIRGLSH